MRDSTRRFLVAAAALAGLSWAAAPAGAQSVADAKATLLAATSSPVTASITDNPVVTQIISNNGTNNTFLIQDATGAAEVYNVPLTTYTAAVGNTLSVSGRIVSFHGLYEMESPYTTVSSTGTGSIPATSVFTTAGLQNGSALGNAQQSTLGTLSNVTFTGATGTFASGGTYTVTDGTLNATVYVPSSDTAIIGTAIPTGAVNVTGYLGQYDSAVTSSAFGPTAASVNGYELDPTSITPAVSVPEPASLALLGLGGLAGLRRRKI